MTQPPETPQAQPSTRSHPNPAGSSDAPVATSPHPAASSVGVGATETVDAVIVGGGHHGLVSAAVLADAGWDVVLLEERPTIGGAVRSITKDGWVMDAFSGCYPLAVASPILKKLELERFGLRWATADTQVAHISRPEDRRAPAVLRSAADTAALLGEDDPRDGATWLAMVEQYEAIKGPFLDALLTEWPPVSAARRLVTAVGATHLPDFARFMLLPTARMGEELFRGRAARELLAGNAMHADAPPTAPVSGVFGWLMVMLAQDVGFPAPVGGAGELAAALGRRAESAGARIVTSSQVTRIVVRDGTARGVETADGRRIAARRAVIADTSAPTLYDKLLPQDAVPPGLRARMSTFLWDLPTVKLNYQLTEPMPWTAAEARGAGVVHVGRDVPGLVRWAADLDSDRVPDEPFALIGQMTSIDATRSPAGTESLWLYTHLPRGHTEPEAAERLVTNSESMLDRFAPGWRDLVRDRWVQTPRDLEEADANLGAGAVGGGTQQLFHQAIWRPVTGFGGPRTHLRGLYLGSAAVHPGGGVHGACGWLAARAALSDTGGLGRRVADLRLGALQKWYADPDAPWVGRVR